MGIKDINNFIKTHRVKTGHEKEIEVSHDISVLKGMRLAIDANILLFRYKVMAVTTELSAYESQEYEFEDIENLYDDKFFVKFSVYDKKLKNLMTSFLNTLLRLSVTPYFIFDGCSFSDAKKEFAHKRRNDQRLSIQKKLASAIENKDRVGTLKYLKQNSNISINDRDLVYDILSDYSVFSRDEEAEQLCVKYLLGDKVDYIYTCDTDVYVYPIKHVINSISLTKREVTIFNIEEAKKCIDLHGDQFTHFCIMLGCDYNERVFRIGPQKSYKFIRDHGSLDEVMRNNSSIEWKSLNFEVCKKLFSLETNKSFECKPIEEEDDLDVIIGC